MLKISISGVRGIVDESLTPSVALDFAKAFGTYVNGGKIVIGRDTRSHGEYLKKFIFSGLKFSGCEIIDLGICPTPTVGILTKHLNARGGIVITASHNPPQWNGIKFFGADGIFLTPQEFSMLENIYNKRLFSNKPAREGHKFPRADAIHINKVLQAVDAAKIKSKKFKVVIDSVNGAGSIITPKLLKKLGCQVIGINTDINRPFPHGPEPTPANLKELCKKVKETKADIGFAQDPDADRLSIVTSSGKAISEEYSVALAAEEILSKQKGRKIAVVNLSTSSLMYEVAKKWKAKLIHTKIGEVYVALKMKKVGAVIGGEGNGGVIYPRVGFNRDSLAGIALILNLLAETGKSIIKIIDEFPAYYLIKNKIKCPSQTEAKQLLKRAEVFFKGKKVDRTEGLKILLKDAWIHIRASNTEPILRIFCEARTKSKAEEIIVPLVSKLQK